MWQWLLKCINDSKKVHVDTTNPFSKYSVFFVYLRNCVFCKKVYKDNFSVNYIFNVSLCTFLKSFCGTEDVW